MKQTIIDLLKILADGIKQESADQCFSYVQQRQMIGRMFGKYDQKDYGMAKVMLRLTVIDSLYSTNAAYSYFSIEEMAEKIIGLGSERECADYFYEVATGATDEKRIFNEPYGIKKNLKDGSKQMSLLSKYAYYLLMQDAKAYPLGFPIYDSLAIESYPKVCSKVRLAERKSIGASIEAYVRAINELREAIFTDKKIRFGLQQFDLLDAYLWWLGKFENGNHSLLLERKDYVSLINNLGLADDNFESVKFNEAVKAKCMELKDRCLVGIKNAAFKAMMKHWLMFYALNE